MQPSGACEHPEASTSTAIAQVTRKTPMPTMIEPANLRIVSIPFLKFEAKHS